MYTVTLDNITIHDPSLNDSGQLILDGIVSKQVNKADSFSFTIYPDNAGYSSVDLMTSWVSVFKDSDLIFHGRVLTEEDGWENEKKIVCEGDLAILNDSILRPYSFSGNLSDYITMLVNQHNAQVGLDKQITIRQIDLPTQTLVRYTSDYKPTLQELMEKVVKYFGGYIVMEYDTGVLYLSYLTDSISGTNQVLEIGKNIIDFNRSISAEALATALIPLGANSDADGTPLTISSVNGGLDYITSPDAATKGLIYAVYKWDTVTDPNELLTKATALLTDLVRIAPRIQLTAVDLSDAGYSIDALGFFEYVTVQDTAHSVSGQYLISERTYNISAPERDQVTFGSEEKTISGQTARAQVDLSSVAAAVINKAVEIIAYQTDLLKGGSGGYFVIGTDSDGHPSEIYFMDTDSVLTAVSVIRINMNGIGFSTTGINGPYTNAWTIDGHLNASFITTGIISDVLNKNSWNMDTGAITITDGSLHITTANYTDDVIVLNYTSGANSYQTQISPYSFVSASEYSGSRNTTGIAGGGMTIQYRPSASDPSVARFRVGISDANFYDASGNKRLVVDGLNVRYLLKDTSETNRMILDTSGLTFYDSGGTATASYPSAGLFKILDLTPTLTSQYFQIIDADITADTPIFIQSIYVSGGLYLHLTYTVQRFAGYANVYVRDSTGTIPDNTQIHVMVLVMK